MQPLRDSFTVASTVAVKAIITNISGKCFHTSIENMQELKFCNFRLLGGPLHNICIAIECYQDYENGFYDTQLLDKCAIIGTEHIMIEEVHVILII